MYTSFYGLNKKPFQISSDPAFMWFGEKHKEALATLKYGILDNKGFLLLTGDVGTGKTTLINSLLESLDDDVVCTSVPDPGLEKLDFFNYIASSFGIDQEFLTKGSFLVRFRQFLTDANDFNKKVLLIIDEAQLLTQELLEEIRLLSNIEKTDAKLINIFFVGQNEFNEILNREQNRAVRQRLTLNYNIDPLTPDETAEYISHRLKIAGAQNTIFTQEATQEVFMYSGGFPRRINIICDHSLLSGYVQEKTEIDEGIVKDCAKDLKIPAYVRNRDIDGYGSYHQTPQNHSDTVVQNQTHRAVIQKQPTYIYPKEQNQKRSSFWGFVVGLFVLLFLTTGYFIIFPEDFKTISQILNKNTQNARTHISEFFNAKDIPDSTIKAPEKDLIESIRENSDSENTEKQPEKKKTNIIDNTNTSISLNIHNIEPIQEELSSQEKTELENIVDELKPMVPDIHDSLDKSLANEKEDLLKISSGDVKSGVISYDKQDVEVKKIIFPLPDKNVIVRFKYNTNDFTDEGFKNLVDFTDILARHPDTEIFITGYTHSEGNKKDNRKLSEFRANIVRSFFLGRGIKQDLVKIRGLGSENPIESNDSAWGRMMNRRVEIEVTK